MSKDYSNEITPHAIYGLDVDRMLLLGEAQLNARSPNNTNFHYIGYNRRPIGAVFKFDGASATGADYKNYATHWQNLVNYLQENHPSANERIKGFYPRDHYVDLLAFKAILWATEYACDHILELEGEGPYRPHPSKPALWRELLMASGIDAIEDRSNTLTGDCDHQIAVLNPDSAKLVTVLENPLSPEQVPGFKLR